MSRTRRARMCLILSRMQSCMQRRSMNNTCEQYVHVALRLCLAVLIRTCLAMKDESPSMKLISLLVWLG